MKSSSLIEGWSALPKDNAIAYYGEENLLEGILVSILEFRAYTEEERLDALNILVDSKLFSSLQCS